MNSVERIENSPFDFRETTASEHDAAIEAIRARQGLQKTTNLVVIHHAAQLRAAKSNDVLIGITLSAGSKVHHA